MLGTQTAKSTYRLISRHSPTTRHSTPHSISIIAFYPLKVKDFESINWVIKTILSFRTNIFDFYEKFLLYNRFTKPHKVRFSALFIKKQPGSFVSAASIFLFWENTLRSIFICIPIIIFYQKPKKMAIVILTKYWFPVLH